MSLLGVLAPFETCKQSHAAQIFSSKPITCFSGSTLAPRPCQLLVVVRQLD